MQNLAIVDLDGVVSCSDVRFERATTNGKIDWKIAFNPELVPLDTLIEGCPACLEQLEANGYQIVFLTSRPEPMREATEQWLSLHRLLGNRRLIMKPLSKQFVKTKTWKAEVVQSLKSEMQPDRVVYIDDERANIDSVVELLHDVMCFFSLDEAY